MELEGQTDSEQEQEYEEQQEEAENRNAPRYRTVEEEDAELAALRAEAQQLLAESAATAEGKRTGLLGEWGGSAECAGTVGLGVRAGLVDQAQMLLRSACYSACRRLH